MKILFDKNDSVLIEKVKWLSKMQPKTAEEAFDMLWKDYEKQTEDMLKMTDSILTRMEKEIANV